MLKESTSAEHSEKYSQCKRAAWSCPRASSESKHWRLLPWGAPQLPDLCGLMAAKNCYSSEFSQLLAACHCVLIEPPGRIHWTPQPPSWPTVRRFLWLLSAALIFSKRRDKKQLLLEVFTHLVPSCLYRSAGRQSPLDPVTCEFTSTALKACPAAGSTTGYCCAGIRDSFTEWWVTAYFLIWINYVHNFFPRSFSPDSLKDQDHRMSVTK